MEIAEVEVEIVEVEEAAGECYVRSHRCILRRKEKKKTSYGCNLSLSLTLCFAFSTENELRGMLDDNSEAQMLRGQGVEFI